MNDFLKKAKAAVEGILNPVDTVGKFFAPKSGEIRKRDYVREGAGNIGDLLKSIARAAPRAVTSVIGSATGLPEIKAEDAAHPTMAKFLLGAEPVKNVRGGGEDIVTMFGGGEDTAKKYGLPVGIALTAADLIPGFSKKKIAEKLAKEGGVDAIKAILKKEIKDIAEDKLDDLARAIAPVKDAKQVTKILDDAAKAAKTGEDAGKFVYHTTSPKNLESIRETGLRPGKKGQYGPGTYFAPSEAKTGGYGSPEGSMLRVNRSKLPDDFQEWPGEQGWTTRSIPPEAIEVKNSSGAWEPLASKTKVAAKAAGDVPPMKSVAEIFDEAGGAARYSGGKGGAEKAARTAAAGAAKVPERRFITRAKELAPEAKDLFEGKYTPRKTQALIDEADELIARSRDEAITLAKTGTDEKAVAAASRLIDDAVERAKSAVDDASKNKWYEEAADVANAAAKNLTEQGRAVQAASILGRMSPEGMARYAARQIQKYNEGVAVAKGTVGGFFKGGKQIPELSAAQLKDITGDMERIAKIADPTERAMEFQKLQKKVASLVPSSLYDKIITVWKAGLLTGIKTSGLNILSNVSHAFTEGVKDVPAALVDRIASMFTGKRTLALTRKGTGGGIKEGVKKGWRYLKTGFDERDIGTKLDYKQVNMGNSKFAKAIQAYEEAVFRLLGSEDQPFYYAAKARSMYSQAIAQAKNAGLRGKPAKEFVENLVANPTDDILKYATLDAETAVFQNATALGKFARGFQKLPGGQVVAPFGKTPSAVATQLINYSPIGIVKTIAQNIGKGRFDQRLFSQGIGRGLTGTAVLYLGMKLYDNDMVTLDWPTSEKVQKQWELEGRLPNTIKIGGKWRNIGILGPAGMALVVGGHVKEAIDESGSFMAGMATILPGIFSAVSEQTFLKGVNQALDAIQDPQRSFRGFASSLAGSVIPTIVSDVARGTDDKERRANDPGDRMMSRIPGLRELLEPKVDTLGNEIETAGFWTTMLDATRPGQPSADPNDPVVKELRRLTDSGNPATPTQLGPKRGYESLSPAENTALWKLAGEKVHEAIEGIMRRPAWKRYDDEEKARVIGKLSDIAKDEARGEIAGDMLAELGTRAEKAALLRKLREEGFVTQNVFGRIPRSERVLRWADLLQ